MLVVEAKQLFREIFYKLYFLQEQFKFNGSLIDSILNRIVHSPVQIIIAQCIRGIHSFYNKYIKHKAVDEPACIQKSLF